MPQRPPVALITKKEAARRCGIHPESVMRLWRGERFPDPVRQNNRPTGRVYFYEHEVEAYLRGLGERRGDGGDLPPAAP